MNMIKNTTLALGLAFLFIGCNPVEDIVNEEANSNTQSSGNTDTDNDFTDNTDTDTEFTDNTDTDTDFTDNTDTDTDFTDNTDTDTDFTDNTDTDTDFTDTISIEEQTVTRINEIRAEVFSGSLVTWNDSLALSAQNHADTLASTNTFAHGSSSYGENLYASSVSTANYVDALNSWDSEKKDFDFNARSCKAGGYCGHYTQLIWENSTEIGCAKSSSASWNTIVVCRFNPAGNYYGETPY